MDIPLWVVVLVLVLIVLLAFGLVALYIQNRRSKHLRSQFGPEYDRAVEQTGNRSRAEASLAEREKRVARFDIHPLRAEERARFQTSWHQVQAEFVDNPKQALGKADALLGEVMSARGYPVNDFEQQAADLSVDHPAVVQNYRAAHEIALRHRRGNASTEDLRQAMLHYRALFDDLVADPGATTAKAS